MAFTADDKKWMEEKFATKQDLEKFATKKDLEKYPTKEYLKNELSKYATKEDLTVSQVRLGIEFDKKLEKFETKMETRFDKLTTTLDVILKEVVAGREHDMVMDHQQEEQNCRLTNLEDRVGIIQ